MRRTARAFATAAALVALVAGAAGCSGTDASSTAAAKPQVVETPKTWPPKTGKGDFATYPYLYGVSWQAPRSWKFERSYDIDDTDYFSWSRGPKKAQSFLVVTVQNSRSTAAEWLRIGGTTSGRTTTLKESVPVPGYGTGIHLRYTFAKSKAVQDELIVTSIDGVLLDLTVQTPDGDTDLVDRLLAGVKRVSS